MSKIFPIYPRNSNISFLPLPTRFLPFFLSSSFFILLHLITFSLFLPTFSLTSSYHVFGHSLFLYCLFYPFFLSFFTLLLLLLSTPQIFLSSFIFFVLTSPYPLIIFHWCSTFSLLSSLLPIRFLSFFPFRSTDKITTTPLLSCVFHLQTFRLLSFSFLLVHKSTLLRFFISVFPSFLFQLASSSSHLSTPLQNLAVAV